MLLLLKVIQTLLFLLDQFDFGLTNVAAVVITIICHYTYLVIPMADINNVNCNIVIKLQSKAVCWTVFKAIFPTPKSPTMTKIAVV